MSLPLVIFFHASFNSSVGVFPILPEATGESTMPLWMGIALGAVAVAVLLIPTGARLGFVEVDERTADVAD